MYAHPVMMLLQTYSKEAAAIAAVLLAFILNRYLRARARLVYSVRHAFTFILDELEDQTTKEGSGVRPVVHTASISVSNLGKDPAEKVEIVFNWKPSFINVWPSRFYETKTAPDQRHSIFLDSLAPGETFGIELLSINQNLPGLNAVRSQNSIANQVPMMPQQVYPRWIALSAGILTMVGAASAVYALLSAVQYIARQ